ncbi:hypothetical protein ACFLU5_17430 [Bacteroidota bacterium]
MITKSSIIISAFFLAISFKSFGQDSINYKAVFPTGISVKLGLGSFSLKDEYISNEEYSCTMPYLNINWVRFHSKNAYRLELEYRYSENISNNNISALGGQAVFNQDFIYPIGNFSLFSRNVYAYLGPSVQVFYYEYLYHFVIPGTFISPETSGLIGSLGINTQFIYPISQKLGIEAFLRSNLISITGKEHDEMEFEGETNPALVSVFTATKFDFDLSARYYLFKRFSASLGYKFDLSRINKWDPYITASNSLNFSMNYTF